METVTKKRRLPQQVKLEDKMVISRLKAYQIDDQGEQFIIAAECLDQAHKIYCNDCGIEELPEGASITVVDSVDYQSIEIDHRSLSEILGIVHEPQLISTTIW